MAKSLLYLHYYYYHHHQLLLEKMVFDRVMVKTITERTAVYMAVRLLAAAIVYLKVFISWLYRLIL